MTATAIRLGEEMAAQWRTAADAGNPAGPLYTAGVFAEADIIAMELTLTAQGCSACTGSHTIDCC